MSDRIVEVELAYPGLRLDVALARAVPEFSRVQWQKLIREERVTVDGALLKPSARLGGGEVARAAIPPVVETEIVAEEIPLNVVYRDDDIIVVDKPAGMVVHPAAGNESGTLVNAILHHFPDIKGVGGEKRPGIVHRLDKHTSGLMVIAQSDEALRGLQQQFKYRSVGKVYLALVWGNVQPPKALIDAPIGRDPQFRQKMAVIPPGTSSKARSAQTRYEVLERLDGYTLVRCQLLTGRTHQIRVHMAYIGYPLVGDYLYGRRKQRALTGRHFLHAAELSFTHPISGESMHFESTLPERLQQLIDALRS